MDSIQLSELLHFTQIHTSIETYNIFTILIQYNMSYIYIYVYIK